MPRPTPKLFTKLFQVECPYCRRLMTNRDGSNDFKPEDIKPGGVLTCDKEDCQMESKLNKTPQAMVADVSTLRGEGELALAAGAEGNGRG